MKKDLFETAQPKKVKNMVIFEMNDKGREHEYKAYTRYIEPFVGFLESLGLEPKLKKHCNDVIIDGVEFGINLENASYMSRNAWTRNEAVRKPENRFVILEIGYHHTKIRVHINKEIDAERLKDRIRKAIELKKQGDKEVNDRVLKDYQNLIQIGKNYSKDKMLKQWISSIGIEKGKLKFNLDHATLVFLPSGELERVCIGVPYIERNENVAKKISDITQKLSLIPDIVRKINSIDPVNDELAAWTQGQHHAQFDMKTEDDHWKTD